MPTPKKRFTQAFIKRSQKLWNYLQTATYVKGCESITALKHEEGLFLAWTIVTWTGLDESAVEVCPGTNCYVKILGSTSYMGIEERFGLPRIMFHHTESGTESAQVQRDFMPAFAAAVMEMHANAINTVTKDQDTLAEHARLLGGSKHIMVQVTRLGYLHLIRGQSFRQVKLTQRKVEELLDFGIPEEG